MYLNTTVTSHKSTALYRSTAPTRAARPQRAAARRARGGTRATALGGRRAQHAAPGRASRSPQTEQALRPCNKHRRSGAPRTHRRRGYLRYRFRTRHSTSTHDTLTIYVLPAPRCKIQECTCALPCTYSVGEGHMYTGVAPSKRNPFLVNARNTLRSSL